MRGRLRALGAAGVQARTFHSAALRQLRYFWPHVHGTELPDADRVQDRAARRRRPPQPAPRRPGAAARPRLRDRVGQGQQRPPRRLRRGSRPPAAGRSPATTPRPSPGSSAAYEEVKRDQGRMDMEDVLLFTAGLLADDERVAAQVRRQYKWFVVDEFQDVSPLQSALLDLWLGGRDELCVVGDPAQTIYSFAGANATYLRDFPAQVPRHHLDRAGPQLPLHARGRRPPPTPCSRARSSRGVELRAQRPAGPAVTYDAEPRRGRRGRGRRRPDRRPARRRPPARRDRGAVPDQRPVRGLRGGAGRPRHPLRRPRRRPVLRPARGPPGGHPAARRRPVRARPPTTAGRDRARRPSPAWAGPPRPPAARGQTRDRWESLQALVDQAAEFAARRRRRPRRLRRRPRPPRRRAARPGRRRRHPGDPPRRQGPGVGLGLPVRAPGRHAADHLRRHPGRGRGGAAAALRRHDPGPARPRPLLGAGPQPGRPRRPQAVPVPRRRCCPRRQRAPASRRAAASVASCRECGKPLATGAEKKRGRCADCPASYDEELFERLREWRQGAGRARRACRRSWSSPTPPCS